MDKNEAAFYWDQVALVASNAKVSREMVVGQLMNIVWVASGLIQISTHKLGDHTIVCIYNATDPSQVEQLHGEDAHLFEDARRAKVGAGLNA